MDSWISQWSNWENPGESDSLVRRESPEVHVVERKANISAQWNQREPVGRFGDFDFKQFGSKPD
jgi:hypothetical protein